MIGFHGFHARHTRVVEDPSATVSMSDTLRQLNEVVDILNRRIEQAKRIRTPRSEDDRR